MSSEVLLVVGVGGMGEVIARRQGVGRRTVLADFSDATLDRVAESMRADGYVVDTVSVDVSDRDSVDGMVEYAQRIGTVRHVAHTAGISPAHATVEAILAVDVLGVAYSLDALGRVIGEGGSGVYIASMAGSMAVGRLPMEAESALRTTPSAQLLDLPFLNPAALQDGGAAYSLAKRSNQVRVEAASLSWGQRGARVNSISPGVISTAMGHQELASESGARMRRMIEHSGTGRVGTPNDIADAAAFLLGPNASFITGTDLLVDGGVVAAVRAGTLELNSV